MIPTPPALRFGKASAAWIGDLAVNALLQELAIYPKPGLVSLTDAGSHTDMNAATFRASAEALRPFYTRLAEAGAKNVGMDGLRTIGRAAERAMLVATGGTNTHRGAIFSLGLLCAAAGTLGGNADRPLSATSLGTRVRCRWGEAILPGLVPGQSQGACAQRRHGAGGARGEAAAGFPSIYRVALPALRAGRRLASGDEHAACVHACFALVSTVDDTNLLRRGGRIGLRFVQEAARGFLERGSVGRGDWLPAAVAIHRECVARRLSPGGSADLLAAALFVDTLEAAPASAG